MQNNWLNTIAKFANQNSPAILSGAAVGGVIATAFLAAKAAPKAIKELEDPAPLDKKEAVMRTWRIWTPTAVAGSATIACIIMSNRLGARQTATVVAAYALADQAFQKYKDEVVEQFGEAKERKVRTAVAAKTLAENPVPDKQVIIVGGGEQLCYDDLSGRYFQSDQEAINRAVNELNKGIIHNLYASLNEWYELLGLRTTALGDMLGWNVDRTLEVVFDSHIADNGKSCLVIQYKKFPIFDYGKSF